MEEKDVNKLLKMFFDKNIDDLVIAEQAAKSLVSSMTRLKDRMIMFRKHVSNE